MGFISSMHEFSKHDPEKEFDKFSKELEELENLWISYQELLLSYKASEEEIKKKNEELKEINETKDKFFSIISHDLRSPFQGLLGISNYLVDELDNLPKEEIKELISTLNDALHNQYKFLDDLLNWSRLQSGRLTLEKAKFNLHTLVENVKNLFETNLQTKKIELFNHIPNEQFIFADEDMIFLLIRNLVSNAIKFTKPFGKIEITSYEFENHLQIVVADNGIGIKPENLDKLFRLDSHYTTRGTNSETGNGLGLTLCKEIVTKHNGQIWVKSEVDKGTKIFFTIPQD